MLGPLTVPNHILRIISTNFSEMTHTTYTKYIPFCIKFITEYLAIVFVFENPAVVQFEFCEKHEVTEYEDFERDLNYIVMSSVH